MISIPIPTKLPVSKRYNSNNNTTTTWQLLYLFISLRYSSTVCFKWIVQLWCLLFNKLDRLTPQTNSTCRKLRSSAFQLESHLYSVFWFGIGRYFPSILPTNTKGKLGRDVSVSFIWQEPLFSLKERLLPPFWWTKPPFWGKNKFPSNLQKGVPAKFHKMELPPNLTVQKYWTKYQPSSAGNLSIPAKLPVNRWDATLFPTIGVWGLGKKSSKLIIHPCTALHIAIH